LDAPICSEKWRVRLLKNTYEVERNGNELVLDQLCEHLEAELEFQNIEDLRIQDLLFEPAVLRVLTLVLRGKKYREVIGDA